MKNRFFTIISLFILTASLMPCAFADEISPGDIIIISDDAEKASQWSTSPSWDGSHFYSIDAAMSIAESENDIADELVISADVKFTEEGSGFLLRSGSYLGGQIIRQGDKILNFASKSRYVEICNCDADIWYNVVMNADFSSDNYHAAVNVYKYNEDGSKTAVAKDIAISLRTMVTNCSPYQKMEVLAGTYIDNVYISKPMADTVSLTMPDCAYAGDTVQAEHTFLRNGVEFDGIAANDMKWEIYNEDNTAPVDDVLVTVNSHGTVTIDPGTDSRKVFVRATLNENGATASAPLTITAREVFTITGVGVNAEKTAIDEIKVDKNFTYNKDVMFILTIYDENGRLIDAETAKINGSKLKIGENAIDLDIALPQNFSNVKIMAWTTL